jgi:hypothetical protein
MACETLLSLVYRLIRRGQSYVVTGVKSFLCRVGSIERNRRSIPCRRPGVLKHSPQYDVGIIHSLAKGPLDSRTEYFKAKAFVKTYRDIIRCTGVNPKLFATEASSEVDERIHCVSTDGLSPKSRTDAKPAKPTNGLGHSGLPVKA